MRVSKIKKLILNRKCTTQNFISFTKHWFKQGCFRVLKDAKLIKKQESVENG